MIPHLQDIGASYHVLPPGRYKASLAEIQAVFAPREDDGRGVVWRDFLLATEALRSALGVHSAWIGGSFTTSKPEPDDIDVTYVIEYEAYLRAKEDDYGTAALSILLRRGPRTKAFDHVDAYLLVMPPTNELNEPAWYMQNRGYWDQFWSKARYDNCGDCPYPRRGYLEVIFGGDE